MSNILTTFLKNKTGEDSPDDNRLPDSFDKLVEPSELERGEYNVRNANPDRELRQSIAEDGILQPLIVRDDPDKEKLQVTDGWQRYQAATGLSIPHLPVDIYEDTQKALNDAEARSIVDDWSSFDMAQHAQFCKQQLDTENLTREEVIDKTYDKTKRSKPTVKRYLNALELPEVLHPLLKNRENVDPVEWMALQNIQADIKQYGGLSWQVAATAGKNTDVLTDEDKLIRLMLETLGRDVKTGKALVEKMVQDPDQSIRMAKESVLSGPSPTEKSQLELPNVYIKMKPQQKRRLLDHLGSTKTNLPKVIEGQLRSLSRELSDDSATLDEFGEDN